MLWVIITLMETKLYTEPRKAWTALQHKIPTIEPQGNFGTPDDPPAAMRYTESRMSLLASQLLDGIDEETVDFEPNYSGETTEPKVLPGRFQTFL